MQRRAGGEESKRAAAYAAAAEAAEAEAAEAEAARATLGGRRDRGWRRGVGIRRLLRRSRALEPEWRNGRRGGLKIRCQQWRVGSSPTSGTAENKGTDEGGLRRASLQMGICLQNC